MLEYYSNPRAPVEFQDLNDVSIPSKYWTQLILLHQSYDNQSNIKKPYTFIYDCNYLTPLDRINLYTSLSTFLRLELLEDHEPTGQLPTTSNPRQSNTHVDSLPWSSTLDYRIAQNIKLLLLSGLSLCKITHPLLLVLAILLPPNKLTIESLALHHLLHTIDPTVYPLSIVKSLTSKIQGNITTVHPDLI